MPDYEQFELDANVWGDQHNQAAKEVRARYPNARVSSKATPNVPGGDRALVVTFPKPPDELTRQATARDISGILEDNRAYVSNVIVKGSGGSEIDDDRLSGLIDDVERHHQGKDTDKPFKLSKGAEYRGFSQMPPKTKKGGRGRVNR